MLCALTVVVPAYAQEEPNYDSMSQAELENELDNTSLGGPITLLAVGGGVAIVGASVALYGVGYSLSCDLAYDVFDERERRCNAAVPILIGLSMVAIGGGTAAGGGIWLGSRISKRRQINRSLERYESSGVSWQVGLAPVFAGTGLRLSASF